jgi:uncharacterized protein DUF5763
MKHDKNRCQGKSKSGNRCRAAATASGLCFFHANPNRAVELGRIGGGKNRHVFAGGEDSPLALQTPQDIHDTLIRLANDVYSGKLSPSAAAALERLLNLHLRAIGNEQRWSNGGPE